MSENQIQTKMQAAQIGQLLGAGGAGGSGGVYRSPTLSENIDQRIASLEDQVDRLNRVKKLLAEPAGMLNVPIDDLRFALSC